MLRPSPVPFRFIYLCSFNFAKSVNSLLKFSFWIPAPVSCTDICSWISFFNSSFLSEHLSLWLDSLLSWILSLSKTSSTILNPIMIYPPSFVNLILFDRKLSKIWRILLLSVVTFYSMWELSVSNSSWSPIFFYSVLKHNTW